jgi:hypothetical protein
MALHLIEVPHADSKIECIKAIQVFLNSGSHFLTNADWGCDDGEHKAWIMIDVNNKEEALQIIPPLYRRKAKVTRVTKYTKAIMDEAAEKYHQA